MVTMKFPLCLLPLISLPLVAAAPLGDPVAPWKANVRVAPVSAVAGRHSIHSYYVANPESPDGKHVLFFTSKHPASYVGEVRILERATGKKTVLAENVHTEDAHRVACQQWLSGGKRVAAPNFTPAHVRTFQTHPHPVTEDGR